jgi:ubiquitin-associated SH3 domain-containing protein
MFKYIVYACPVGELAQQLSTYFEKSRLICGSNAAHDYMPHCSLTGFFEDVPSTVPNYTQKLERSFKRFRKSQPHPPVEVNGLSFRDDWHGLELTSDWLRKLMHDFACTATSATRKTPLRLKEWLHLSLAYNFVPDQAATLVDLAQELVDPQAEVNWELRFYQQNPDKKWICHQQLKLPAMPLEAKKL